MTEYMKLTDGIPKSKVIDGKRYNLYDIYITPSFAKTQAEKARRIHGSARVVEMSMGRWAVYCRDV
jgi:hypothetical protein